MICLSRIKKYFVLDKNDQDDITLAFKYGRSSALAWVLISLTALAGVITEVVPDLEHFHLLVSPPPLSLLTALGGLYSYYIAGTVFFFFWQLSRWMPNRPRVKRRTGWLESICAVVIITFVQGVVANIADSLITKLHVKTVTDTAESSVTFHGTAWHKFISYAINNWYEIPSEDVFRLSLFSLIFVALLWIKRPTLRYWLAFLITALLFGAWHYSSYSYHMTEVLIDVGLPTLLDGCLWLRTRNLWTFTASHLLYDYSGNL
ncbi:hypothetical protein FD35_GL000674 [Furfurilactobacillus rossiae DSM 15814]|uniref:CAAX prenyl protease 2/Lysostaphin resistance protein A-like domain-containing protein n=1 Tax=Furfurilactobacillus rossiae DSM 15814 TaxID=1114972 RepID=A0A0R1RAW2_9LACO|nr:hypothetical protein FD35_GL000674 [Furfurilactobacillus rossiae DSM 15814]